MKSRSCLRLFVLAAFCLSGVAPSSAAAAEREFVGVLALLQEKSVAEQLRLTDEQRRQLLALIERRESEVLETALSLRQATAAEREAKLAPFRQASEVEGLKLLDPAQRAALEQLRLRRAGAESLGEPAVATTLKLSAEQIQARDQLLAERAAALAKATGQEREVLRVAFEQRLFALLAPDQKTAWETAAGAAVVNVAEAPPTATSPPPAVAGAADPATAKTTDATKTVAAPRRGDDVRLKFNFRFQPWGEVLDWFAEQAELSLLMDAPPPGTLNYTDPRSYTPAEALDLMNGVLLTKGYTLVRRERMLIVVNLEDGIPPNLVSFVQAEKLDERGEFELVTTLFPIGVLNPEDVESELRKLMGPQGSVVVLPKARQVQATETAGRLRLMRSVLEASQGMQAATTGPIRAFQPVHIAVEDALPLLRQLLNIPDDSNADPDGNVRIAVDPLTGKLLVSGKPDRVNQVAEIMKAIDVPTPTTTVAVVEEPQLEVYEAGAIDPATALAVLQTLLAGYPDVRLTTDAQTGKLVALARPTQHATIRATLAQLQREGRLVDVVQLQRVDPQLAMQAIGKLFGGAGATAGAPQIEVDPLTRQLILRGTASQLAQIRELLGKLGETVTDGGQAAVDTSTVRLLPLGSRSVRQALEQIDAVWPTLRRNPIRVVTPSAAIEAVYPGARDKAAPAPQPTPTIVPNPPAPKVPAPASPTPSAPAPAAAPKTSGEPTPPEAERQASARPIRVRTVSFLADGAPPAAAPNGTAKSSPAGEPAPIIVSSGPAGVVIASDDVEALNEFEALLNSLVQRTGTEGKEFAVFYLENAGAAAAAETLDAVFGSGGGAGGSSLMGDLAGMALGSVGGNLLGAMMGGSSGPAASISASSSVLIVPDSRLNALIVQAAPADLDLMEQLLRVIDRVDVPESTVNPRPRIIAVHNTSATQVAEIVREVYQERMAGANRQRQPSPEELMQLLRSGGGGGGRGGSGASRSRQPEAPKISIGVDSRTNSLIVSASEPVFEEIERLVQTLDQATSESNQAIRVVTLKRSNAEEMQKALSAIVGEKAMSSKSSSGGSSGGGSGSSSGGSGGGSSSLSPEARQVQDLMRQRLEMFNQMRNNQPNRDGGNRNNNDGRGDRDR